MTARDALPLGHFIAMCDDTGLFQHAIYDVPDRLHGYCVDDNARALLLCCKLDAPDERAFGQAMAPRFAAFVQHAWNPDVGRFRNFMSFDRRWLEDVGSEDCQGHALWALGLCVSQAGRNGFQMLAAELFEQALPVAADFKSPRAWAFTLIGIDEYLRYKTVTIA